MDAHIGNYGVLVRISPGYPPVQGRLHTRYSPVRRSPPAYCYAVLPLDLHVLSLPLAFILSQDQTLRCIIYSSGPASRRCPCSYENIPGPCSIITKQVSSTGLPSRPVCYSNLSKNFRLVHISPQKKPPSRSAPFLGEKGR